MSIIFIKSHDYKHCSRSLRMLSTKAKNYVNKTLFDTEDALLRLEGALLGLKGALLHILLRKWGGGGPSSTSVPKFMIIAMIQTPIGVNEWLLYLTFRPVLSEGSGGLKPHTSL